MLVDDIIKQVGRQISKGDDGKRLNKPPTQQTHVSLNATKRRRESRLTNIAYFN